MAQNDGIQNSNSLNNPEYSPRGNNANTFSINFKKSDTFRFGEIRPLFGMETVNGDYITSQISHELRAYTFSSPFLSSLKMHRSTFAVPKIAITPRLYDLMYMNPKIGDDIVKNTLCRPLLGLKQALFGLLQACNIVSSDLSSEVVNLFSSSTLSPKTFKDTISNAFLVCRLADDLLSNSSLLASLGYKYFCKRHSVFNTATIGSVLTDVLPSSIAIPAFTPLNGKSIGVPGSASSLVYTYDELISFIDSNFGIISSSGDFTGFSSALLSPYYLSVSSVRRNSYSDLDGSPTVQSFSRRMSDYFYYHVLQHNNDPDAVFIPSPLYAYYLLIRLRALVSYLPVVFSDLTSWSFKTNFSDTGASNDFYIDIQRVLAYQLSCVQYFTNDNVDVVHESQLYLRSMESLLRLADTNFPNGTVEWNGISLSPDVLSGYAINRVFNTLSNTSGLVPSSLYYLLNIFDIQNSLVYGDYFVGCREKPLAIDEEDNVKVSIPASQDGQPVSVSAIDITKSIIWQKFTNRLNRIHMTMREYSRAIFGKSAENVPYQPYFISDEEFSIFGQETTNSADNQGNITTNLNVEQSRMQFQLSSSDDCELIVVYWFDCPRIYDSFSDRITRHLNRFDDFQPDLQNVGDQPINVVELTSDFINDVTYQSGEDPLEEPFGYTGRYMEYKQTVSQTNGGFTVDALPSWQFIWRNPWRLKQISSDFVRAYPFEFDRFYKSLTAFGNVAQYFHFIIDSYISIEATRPMEYNPNILD